MDGPRTYRGANRPPSRRQTLPQSPQSPEEASRPAGQTFLFWLATAAVEAREAAGEDPETIAYVLRVRAETVRRFEKAEHWPREPERMMAAYAAVARITDPRDLYDRAMSLWREHGSSPSLDDGEDEEADPANPQAGGSAGRLPDLQARARRLPPPRPPQSRSRVRRNVPATDDLTPGRRRNRA
jgi:hypothetical protein